MYNTLTALIDEYIHQNGTNEITGPVLNSVLRDMVDALGNGMRFMGVANSATVPAVSDAPKFYLSFTPGAYPNFFSAVPAFMSGLAIFYDIAGTNTWAFYNWPLEQPQSGPESFVVDADIFNNSYPGDTILYVSEATRSSSGSSITVKRTDTSGTDYGQVAYIPITGQPSGFKSYISSLSDAPTSKLSLSVNWDTVTAGSAKDFSQKEAAMPQKAYSSQASLKSIYDRLQLLEYSMNYVNSAADGVTPIAETYNGLGIKKYAMISAQNYDPDDYNRGDNALASQQARRVYKISNPTFKLNIVTANLDGRDFHTEVIITNDRGSEGQTVEVSFGLDSYDGFKLIAPEPIDLPFGKSMLVTIYGVDKGAYNTVYSDTYTVHIFTNHN